MRLSLASFTDRGAALADRLAAWLDDSGHSPSHTRLGGDRGPSLAEWTAASFGSADALVFVGAVGIAVRAIAPHLKSKTTDPAVVAVDEAGRFCIPLVSGHIGGANQLASQLAVCTGATAVITTATDLRGLFAVDSWAVEQGLGIQNPERIKGVSAKLLNGESIAIASDFPVEGTPPPGVVMDAQHPDVAIRLARPDTDALWLVPPAVTVGIGCRKGAGSDRIARVFHAVLEREGIPVAAVCRVCSIDLKAREPGLLDFCQALSVPLQTFSADQLRLAPGAFTPSPFVEEVTGVDNVCERAAVLGSGGTILTPKTAEDGVTVALAVGDHPLTFAPQTQPVEEFQR